MFMPAVVPSFVPGRLPGLYLAESNPDGRRHFYYWRGDSPARELFELPQWGGSCEALLKAKLIYFSGITLSLYSNTGIGRFLAVVEVARPANENPYDLVQGPIPDPFFQAG